MTILLWKSVSLTSFEGVAIQTSVRYTRGDSASGGVRPLETCCFAIQLEENRTHREVIDLSRRNKD
jgi:hypothetical protein